MTFEFNKFYNLVFLYGSNFITGIIPDPYPWK